MDVYDRATYIDCRGGTTHTVSLIYFLCIDCILCSSNCSHHGYTPTHAGRSVRDWTLLMRMEELSSSLDCPTLQEWTQRYPLSFQAACHISYNNYRGSLKPSQ